MEWKLADKHLKNIYTKGDNTYKAVEFKMQARKNILCFCCGEKDHIAKDCPKRDGKSNEKQA